MLMSMRSDRFALSATALFVSLAPLSSAMAAGYEKALTWSAKAAAMGGTAVGSTKGAEALYFNPAGLALSSSRPELSLNFSPTFTKASGANPYHIAGGSPVSSDSAGGFSPIVGIVASYRPMPKLGLGAGYYLSGGTKAKFADLDYSTVDPDFNALHPTVEMTLSISEFALGAGYEAAPGIRLGLAWRLVSVSGNFSNAIVNGNTLTEGKIENLSAKDWMAFKLGAQYEEPAHRWGLGLAIRSSVGFTAKGDASARFQSSAGTVTDIGTGTAEIKNTFPLQLVFGGWTRATELVRIGWEYSFTNYSKNTALDINGTAGGVPFSDIPQQWSNQHLLRAGMEYTGMGLPIRAGLAYTTQVTSSDFARSTFSSPGPGYTLAFGSGMLIGYGVEMDGAIEYSRASGKGRNTNAAGTAQEVPAETDFSTSAVAVHTSAKFHF